MFLGGEHLIRRWVRLVVAALLGLALAAVGGWLVVATPLWVILGFAGIAALPFVLTYATIQFVGLVVARDDRQWR